MIGGLPPTLLGLRDRAILLFCFASAMRRSELAAVEVDDLAFGPEGVEVVVRRSKADQVFEGQRIFVPRGGEPCPVAALEDWLEASGIVEGFLFRRVSRADRLLATPLQGQAIAELVHRAARGAGLDPRRFSGHSLRAGFATAAASQGASTWAILAITRHRSAAALKPYIRPDRAREFGDPVRVL
jgi:integrase